MEIERWLEVNQIKPMLTTVSIKSDAIRKIQKSLILFLPLYSRQAQRKSKYRNNS